HTYVADGPGVDAAAIRPRGGAWKSVGWDALASTPLEPGPYEVRVSVAGDTDAAGASVEIPPCAGRRAVTVDGAPVAASPSAPDGPIVAPITRGPHEVVLR